MPLAAFITSPEAECIAWQGEPNVSFEDDSTYFALESYLNDESVGAKVDLYDGARFSGDSILPLVARLHLAISEIGRKPTAWIVRTEQWEQGGKQYTKEYKASRDTVIRVATRLLELAQDANATGKRLTFAGD